MKLDNPNNDDFQEGYTNTFWFNINYDIGHLEFLEVWESDDDAWQFDWMSMHYRDASCTEYDYNFQVGLSYFNFMTNLMLGRMA